ncbi:MAG: hypothetical protein GXO91_09410 [FCB group bacterium]|nr:hypothetical protein [FCB group bacterium]
MTIVLLFILILLASVTCRLSRQIITDLSPLLALLVLGLLFAWDHELYNIFKDIWYVGKAVLFLILGYVLMTHIRDIRLLFRVIVMAGLITSVYRILQFVFDPELLKISFIEMRRVIGSGNFNTVLALAVLYTCRVNRIVLFSKRADFLIAVTAMAALISSYSRTYWVSFFIMVLISGNYLSLRRPRRLMLLSLAAAGLVAIFLLDSPDKLDPENMSFIEKVTYSFKEVDIRNQIDYMDRNINWRGYEAFRGIMTYSKGTVPELLLGQGFGTLVDLGFYIPLGGYRIRYIPILHNGYVYILLKTGVLGILIYVYLFLTLSGRGRRLVRQSRDPLLRAGGRLITGLSFVFLLTTLVMAGLFSKEELLSATIFLGALLALTPDFIGKTSRSFPASAKGAEAI